MRRRPVSPTLRWRSAGPNRQYRVTIRDEDTGEQKTVYDGYRLECHLPAEFRLSPNQLTFRVQSRPSDAETEPYVTSQPYKVIPRLGDDLETEAKDVLSRSEIASAQLYRCQIRNTLTREVVVDMTRVQPTFLVPPGRLVDGDYEWTIRAMIQAAWQRSTWTALDSAAIIEARLRADRLIPIDVEETGSSLTPSSSVWPAPPQVRSSHIENPNVLAIAVSVSAAPQLLHAPSVDAIERDQWGNGSGFGAVDRVARGLEARGLTGAFFLDIELGVGLRTDGLWRLGHRLAEAGHHVGILIGNGALTPKNIPAPTRVASMKAVFSEQFGAGDPTFMLEAGQGRINWFRALIEEGAPSIVVSRQALLQLPEWMRWRTTPFAASAETIVFPVSGMLSTPAHTRDRVSRHVLSNRDPMLAGSVGAFVDTVAAAGAGPFLAAIDPLLLLDRRKVRDRDAANAWNAELRESRPDWLAAGWKRLHSGFETSAGLSEIRVELLDRLLDGLAATRSSAVDWPAMLGEERHVWVAAGHAFDPLVEYRRGGRVFRLSAVRRYDNNFRLALAART